MSTRSKPEEDDDNGPVIINDNPTLRSYYESLESRLGYWLMLGDTRHFAYWDKDTYFALPLNGPLRKMEQKLFELLDLKPGSRVLDAGCGVGHVALYMASRGLRVTAIDVTRHHVVLAKENVAADKEYGPLVSVDRMDYHHLETLESGSLDGVYTMETFVHATDAVQVAQGFYRLLRPGGHIAMHEYDHSFDDDDEKDSQSLRALKEQVFTLAAMPTWSRATTGYYKQVLEDVGFVDVEVRDYSENVKPMLRLFWMVAVIPVWFITFFGMEEYFPNAISGATGYRVMKYCRYVAISGRKPEDDA